VEVRTPVHSEPSQAESPPGLPSAPVLAEELTGRLRCAACRYELRGLSIKNVCPECGLAIQATLLSLVDPRATEIQPIGSPRLVAVGIVAWSVGAFVAVVLGWATWASGAIDGTLGDAAQHRLVIAGAVSLAVSGLGALAIIRPHARIPLHRSVAAAIGVALYPVAIKLYVDLGTIASAGPGGSFLGSWTGSVDPMPWRWERLAMWLTLAAGAWLLRGNLRILAARSFVMRAGRVDRQTIFAAMGSVLIAAVGDGLGLCASLVGEWGGAVVLASEALVGIGAALLTLGMVGIVIDTLRLTPAVFQRPLALGDVLGGAEAGGRS
jgi:hypothetical protein